jgi:Fe-S cluster assembly protein SufD
MNIVDFTNLHDTFSSSLTATSELGFRSKCMDIFKKYGLPSRKQEAWRYANISSWSLPSDLVMPVFNSSMQHAAIKHLGPELIKDADIINYNGAIIVLNEVPGVSVVSIEDLLSNDVTALDELIANKIAELCPQNPFIAYAIACLSGGFCIKVDENVNNIPHIKVLNYKDKNVFANEFNWIDIGANSKLDLCVRYDGHAEGSYWLNSLNYITLAENSELISEVLQNESDLAISQNTNIVMQDKASRYIQKEFSCGAKVSRAESIVCFNAEESFADLSGVNHVKTNSWHNTNITLKHLANKCISRQNFRSILHTKSMGIFLGHIYVPKGVKGSEAYQDSKNMLLGSGARAIAKPYLEIYTDDVVCTHSATVGQIDKNMIFFLLSRGVSKDQAKSLLLKSFICEIFAEDSALHFAKIVLELISNYNVAWTAKTSEKIC